MNLNGFDNQQPELAKNGRGGRFNPWTAQHKAKLKANAQKRRKKVAVIKPMPT